MNMTISPTSTSPRSISEPPLRRGQYDLHVVPSGKKLWAVKAEHQQAYSGYFATQLEATAYAMHLARQSAASVIIHGRDGRFRTVWSY